MYSIDYLILNAGLLGDLNLSESGVLCKKFRKRFKCN